MPAYPDLAVKLAMVTGCSWDIGAVPCRLLTESGAKVAVNEQDAGLAIEIEADFADFVAVEAMRPQVEEKCDPIEVLVPFAGARGRYVPTEQIGGEVG